MLAPVRHTTPIHAVATRQLGIRVVAFETEHEAYADEANDMPGQGSVKKQAI